MTNAGVNGYPSSAVSLGALDQRYQQVASVTALTSGQSTFDRRLAQTSATMTSQVLRLMYFQSVKTETVSQIRLITAGTAAGATPTVCRAGIYGVNADGSLVLLSAIVNDTTLFAGASTAYTRSLASGVALTTGIWYALGVLVVTGATAPTLSGGGGAVAVEMFTSPRLVAAVTSQSDLPNTIASSSLGTSSAMVYAALLP